MIHCIGRSITCFRMRSNKANVLQTWHDVQCVKMSSVRLRRPASELHLFRHLLVYLQNEPTYLLLVHNMYSS